MQHYQYEQVGANKLVLRKHTVFGTDYEGVKHTTEPQTFTGWGPACLYADQLRNAGYKRIIINPGEVILTTKATS